MVPKSRWTVAAAPGNGGSDNAVFCCCWGGLGGGCVVWLVGAGLYCTYVRRWGVGCVSRPRPAGEGLCQVRLLLPTMDAIAASARAASEQRTPAQIRADAVTAMTLSTLRTSQMAAYQPAAKASDVRDGAPASLDDGGGGIDGDLSTLGSAPRSWASPNSPAPGCLLPDGVPLWTGSRAA